MKRPSKETIEQIRQDMVDYKITYSQMARNLGCARSALWDWLNLEPKVRTQPIQRYHKYVLLPCLDAKMKAVGASNLLLEAASGVSTRTINAARNGRKIRLKLGLYIMEALNSRTFQRGRSGPHKWSKSRRAYVGLSA